MDETQPEASLAEPSFVAAGDAAVLIRLGNTSDDATLDRVLAWFHAFADRPPPWLVNLHPAYTSLLVELDLLQAELAEVERHARALAPSVAAAAPRPARTVEVPVRYGGDDGPDLLEVAQRSGLSAAAVTALHSGARYRVAFLGFQPGFAYLLGLPPELAVPRRHTPRSQVPAGSVAIGGAQTAVYPTSTPGGWNLIGRTPRRLEADWVEPGDVVRFVPA